MQSLAGNAQKLAPDDQQKENFTEYQSSVISLHPEQTHGYPDTFTPAVTSGELLPHHYQRLSVESALSDAVIKARGYFSTADSNVLKQLGFSKLQCLAVPTLVIPLHDAQGERIGYIHRPDIARNSTTSGKPIKYETMAGASPALDIPVVCVPYIGDPSVPLLVTEGPIKGDAAASKDLCVVALPGVNSLRGRNSKGGLVAHPDWERFALNGRTVYVAFDSDIETKPTVESALRKLCAFLQGRGAIVKVIYFKKSPEGKKTGLDDFFARGASVADLFNLARELELVAETKRKKSEEKLAEQTAQVQARGLPVIETHDRQFSDKVNDFAGALAAFNGACPRIFDTVSRMSLIGRDKDDEPQIDPIGVGTLQVLASQAATWVSTSEREGVRNVTPPRELCEAFIKTPSVWQNIPPLDSIATAPFIDTDGTLCKEPGYHKGARVWLSLPPGFEMPDTDPTAANIARAKALLFETILGEVAFADAASSAHAIALMILPFVRRLIADSTPLHLFDAPAQSSGKTYAAQLCIAPFREAIPMAENKNAEENRKTIFAKLASGVSHVLIDNCKGDLSDVTLSTAITSGKMEGRQIGTGNMVTVSARVVWVATSNNASLDKDAVSRCILIRLDTNRENPEGRKFNRDPLRYIAANRAEVIGAILTLVRAWQAAGSPLMQGESRSRFKRWESVMGGILAANGIDGFLDNIQQGQDDLDTETVAWREFVTEWWHRHGDSYVESKALLPLAEKCGELAALIGDREAPGKRFGRMLLNKRDKVFCKLKITRSSNSDKKEKVAKWRLNPLADFDPLELPGGELDDEEDERAAMEAYNAQQGAEQEELI